MPEGAVQAAARELSEAVWRMDITSYNGVLTGPLVAWLLLG